MISKAQSKLLSEIENLTEMHVKHFEMRLADVFKNTKMTESGCWHYQGRHNACGYPQAIIRGSQYYLHRISYMFFYNVLLAPEQLCLHKCNNTACFNPLHLYIGTHADNARDRIAAGATTKKTPRELVIKAKSLIKLGYTTEEIADLTGLGVFLIVAIKQNRRHSDVEIPLAS
jgi:hypothetical protein